MPGTFHLNGKAAFDREIENDAFTGRPVVTTTRLVEENDVVVAEGTVRAAWKNGGVLTQCTAMDSKWRTAGSSG